MVSGGGTTGSVRGVCGGVMARVAPILAVASRSMSDVDVVEGAVLVVLSIALVVAGWERREERRCVVVVGGCVLAQCTICVRALGTC